MPRFSASSIACGVDLLRVDQRLGFLLEQDLAGLGDGQLAAGRCAWAGSSRTCPGGRCPSAPCRCRRSSPASARCSTAISTLRSSSSPAASMLAHLLACADVRGGSSSSARFASRALGRAGRAAAPRRAAGLRLRPASARAARTRPMAIFDQVADHALDVAAVVADLGVLGRLDLDERGAGELGQPAGDLGLADAGRADHEDVLGRHFLPQLVGQAAAAASGCAWRWPRPAWRRPGRRCSGRARRRSAAGVRSWLSSGIFSSARTELACARQFLHGDVPVRVDVDVGGDLQRLRGRSRCADSGVGHQGPAPPPGRSRRRSRCR